MTEDEELAAIRSYIEERGLTRVVPPEYLKHIGMPQFSRSKRADWQKGRRKPPRWRYNLAISYAHNNGLDGPAWTDAIEGQLETCCALGFSYRQMARLLNKSKASIQARVRYLRLGRRLFREAGRSR